MVETKLMFRMCNVTLGTGKKKVFESVLITFSKILY